MVAAPLRPDLAERLAAAMGVTGLSGADLCRVGLLRVIGEIEATGSLSVGATAQVRAARG